MSTMILTSKGNNNVTIVYGAPCSGRGAYIRNTAKPQDIMIDIEAFKRVITNISGDDMTDQHKCFNTSQKVKLVEAFRAVLYSMISCGDLAGAYRIWIRAELPIKEDREYLVKRLRADTVFIDADPIECLHNLMMNDNIKDKKKGIERIDQYFDSLQVYDESFEYQPFKYLVSPPVAEEKLPDPKP